MKGKPDSNFLTAARALDSAFDEIEQLAGSLGRLELNSEVSLDKARQLLERFSERSQTLGPHLLSLSQALQERQGAVQTAVEKVAELAPHLQEKLLEAQGRLERFQTLGLSMKDLTVRARELGPDQVARELRALTDQAMELQEEARAARMPGLERSVQNLRKTLKSLASQLEANL